jgi:hypothetical protein
METTCDKGLFLYYNEEVHRSRISGEWNNTIGYKIGPSLAKVCTTPMTSPVENFKHECKNNMVVNMATFSRRSI